jgi:hypothetical protein
LVVEQWTEKDGKKTKSEEGKMSCGAGDLEVRDGALLLGPAKRDFFELPAQSALAVTRRT